MVFILIYFYFLCNSNISYNFSHIFVRNAQINSYFSFLSPSKRFKTRKILMFICYFFISSACFFYFPMLLYIKVLL